MKINFLKPKLPPLPQVQGSEVNPYKSPEVVCENEIDVARESFFCFQMVLALLFAVGFFLENQGYLGKARQIQSQNAVDELTEELDKHFSKHKIKH